MRLELGSIKGLAAATVAAGLIFYSLGSSNSFGDEPGRLGRLFRMGNSGSNSGSGTNPGPSANSTAPAPSFHGQPALSTPPSTLPGGSSGPRVTPRPRVNKPATEADPLVTRISLGRSDNGSQFGMLLQVFADGTVIDGEGVHHVGSDVLKPVADAVASGDLARLKGHCGGPAGDFVENVHVIVFERSLGRLRASSFSYSGNPQGCDHAVHHLQKVLDELQAKLSPGVSSPAPTASNAPAPSQGLTSPPLPLTSTP
jgi:hypothetical protein